MSMSLSPTARGLRLIRATHSPSITLPPPAGVGPQTLLITDANDQIATETGARIITETA
jgi:hypothetical protein